MTLRYTIPLDPRTKKNHQMIAGTGGYCPYCGKPKKQFIRQSSAHTEYVTKAFPFLVPKPEAPIDTPVQVTYRFYMHTRRKVRRAERIFLPFLRAALMAPRLTVSPCGAPQ